MSRLTSSMLASWSGVSTYGKASSSSRCHGVSGPKRGPVACRAAYSLISSAAICRTALRARPLRLAQSPPPRRSSAGRLAADVAGDLVELVGRHEEPVAAAGRAWRRRTRARGTRGSRPARCAAPSRRSGRRRAGRARRGRRAQLERVDWLRRRVGSRRMSRGAAALPVRSCSVSTASASGLGDEAVRQRGPGPRCTRPPLGVGVASRRPIRAGTSCSAEHLGRRAAWPCPSVTTTTRQPSASQPRDVARPRLGVAAVGRRAARESTELRRRRCGRCRGRPSTISPVVGTQRRTGRRRARGRGRTASVHQRKPRARRRAGRRPSER